jgi:hypothetical protein
VEASIALNILIIDLGTFIYQELGEISFASHASNMQSCTEAFSFGFKISIVLNQDLSDAIMPFIHSYM